MVGEDLVGHNAVTNWCRQYAIPDLGLEEMGTRA